MGSSNQIGNMLLVGLVLALGWLGLQYLPYTMRYYKLREGLTKCVQNARNYEQDTAQDDTRKCFRTKLIEADVLDPLQEQLSTLIQQNPLKWINGRSKYASFMFPGRLAGGPMAAEVENNLLLEYSDGEPTGKFKYVEYIKLPFVKYAWFIGNYLEIRGGKK